MVIAYKEIVLRDYQQEDIADDIRWMTVETSWSDWDAPWLTKEDIRAFDQAAFVQKKMKKLSLIQDDQAFRWGFEIDTQQGVHIGSLNCYLNDKEYNWKSKADGGCLHTLGIDISESAYWYKGLGTQAFVAYINYNLSHGIYDLYTETWSGNGPMIRMAEKIGFEVCRRTANAITLNGQCYDSLAFKLNRDKFNDYLGQSQG